MEKENVFEPIFHDFISYLLPLGMYVQNWEHQLQKQKGADRNKRAWTEASGHRQEDRQNKSVQTHMVNT